MKLSWLIIPIVVTFFLLEPLSSAAANVFQEPKLIRDTDVAEGNEETEAPAIKEPNPKLAEQNIKIGNYYLKQQNFAAAIRRFLEAIEYKKDAYEAYEGLVRAYERNGDIRKAIDTCKIFLEKNPQSPKVPQFRNWLAKLEKKAD